MRSRRRVLDRRLGAIRAKLGVAAQQPNEGNDRQALERLLRSCARPCWASERLLEAGDGEHLVDLLPKSGAGFNQIEADSMDEAMRIAGQFPWTLRQYRGPPGTRLAGRTRSRWRHLTVRPAADAGFTRLT